MDVESTSLQPLLHRLQNCFCSLLRTTVDENVVCISFERRVWMMLRQPRVEHEMQKDVRQHWANHAALRRPFRTRLESPVGHLHGSFQPPFDVQQNPPGRRVPFDRTHHEIVIERVKEGSDIEIENPVEFPTAFPRPPYRVDRRATRTIPV